MNNLRYLKYSQIDKVKWDHFIHMSCNEKVYAYSWYLDIVACNWGGLIYNDYELVFPVVFKNIFFLKNIYHPLFCQQLGPFGSKKHLLNQNILSEILILLDQRYKNFVFSINDFCVSEFKDIIDHNYLYIKYLDRVNLELDLNCNYSQIRDQYNSNTKRKLKSSVNTELVLQDVSLKEFMRFYKQNVHSKLNLNFLHYRRIYSLIQECLFRGKGRLLGLRDTDSNLFASAFFLFSSRTSILLFNASDNSIQKNGMTLLIDEYIQIYHMNISLLDFEGSNIPGVRRFYQGFGAKEKNYIYIIK